MVSQATQLSSAEALRRARDRRGESLEQVAQRTRISDHYMEALERDAPISSRREPTGTSTGSSSTTSGTPA
jgi:hypothetical protein